MKEILVFADWHGLPQIQLMGRLRIEMVKGEEIFSFEYDKIWLESGLAQELDPELTLYAGPQYIHDDKPNFGLFLDSAPDRWGRMLMDRREALKMRVEGKAGKKLLESDYLLGVDDETRMGALRFKLQENQAFLANEQIKIPPITRLRELEQASLRIEADDFFQNPEDIDTLSLLIAPGSSLGGARPKSNVRDLEGNLWIAKFPSRNDDINSGAWEFVANQLAREVGIDVAEADAQKFSQKQHTYLTRRFDRIHTSKRIHFASAMTLLGYKDGYNHREGGSYLEILEFIEQYGAQPDTDIKELWKRIVFSVAISNTDDHLRNHGFLLTPMGWKLSPAYDINPNPRGNGLSINISDEDNALDFDLCLDVADFFRWPRPQATAFIQTTQACVKRWRSIAKSMNIPFVEQEIMKPAFLSTP